MSNGSDYDGILVIFLIIAQLTEKCNTLPSTLYRVGIIPSLISVIMKNNPVTLKIDAVRISRLLAQSNVDLFCLCRGWLIYNEVFKEALTTHVKLLITTSIDGLHDLLHITVNIFIRFVMNSLTQTLSKHFATS